jgi:hypothetical protein
LGAAKAVIFWQVKLVGPENRQTSDGKKHIQIARVKLILFIGAISFVQHTFSLFRGSSGLFSGKVCFVQVRN